MIRNSLESRPSASAPPLPSETKVGVVLLLSVLVVIAEAKKSIGKGFKYLLVVTMDSKDSLAAYGPHPKHQEFVASFVKDHLMADGVLAMDIESKL